MRAIFPSISAAAFLYAINAYAVDLAAGAKKATMDEFKAFADGKQVEVEILDLKKPVTAELVWSWKKGTTTGRADVAGKMIDVKTKLTFKGDKACSAGKGEKPSCHFIYIDGDKFYEVRDDMKYRRCRPSVEVRVALKAALQLPSSLW
ncbi:MULTISPECIES: hypothetical protein [unclassified Rhizobium]|uniref:hypothetical protein n=1 Tax=unclassified Rhizobium TaxID=2613769 RepID=UPI002180B4A1|nr:MULTISPECIES: hypothetical protein [unclassified Rhizobium]